MFWLALLKTVPGRGFRGLHAMSSATIRMICTRHNYNSRMTYRVKKKKKKEWHIKNPNSKNTDLCESASVMTLADRQPLHQTVLPGSPESRASSRSCTRTTRSPRAGSWTRTGWCPPTPPSCSCETIWQLQVDKLKVIRCRLYLANSWGISSSLAEVVVMSNNRDMGRKRSHFRPPGIVIASTIMVVSDAALSRICNIIHCKVENLKVGSQRADH